MREQGQDWVDLRHVTNLEEIDVNHENIDYSGLEFTNSLLFNKKKLSLEKLRCITNSVRKIKSDTTNGPSLTPPTPFIEILGVDLSNKDLSKENLSNTILCKIVDKFDNRPIYSRHGEVLENLGTYKTSQGYYARHPEKPRINEPSEFISACLDNAICRETRFDNSDLSGTSLKSITAEDASFIGADLRYADFTGANLTGADFTGANLKGAIFTGAILDGAKFDNTTKGLDQTVTAKQKETMIDESEKKPSWFALIREQLFYPAGRYNSVAERRRYITPWRF